MFLPLVEKRKQIHFKKNAATGLESNKTQNHVFVSISIEMFAIKYKQINKPNEHTLTYIIVILFPMTGDKKTENETSSNEENRIE